MHLKIITHDKIVFDNEVNEIYTMLAKLVHTANNDEIKMFRKLKPKNTCLV